MKSQSKLIIVMAVMLSGLITIVPVWGRNTAQSAVGFVAGIQGKGYIIRNGDTIMITGMDLLYPGDSVQLSKGAKARISVCGSKGYEIRGTASFTLRTAGISFKRGKASKTYGVDRKSCIAALDVFRKNEKMLPDMIPGERKGTLMLRSRKKSERRGVYVVRGRKQQPVIELFSDRLIPRKPLLVWTAVAGRASYRIAITSAGETIWSATVQKNTCEYPENAPRLNEGQAYDITVEALTGQGDVIARGSGTLSLFSSGEMESFRQDESSIRTLLPDSSPEQQITLGKLYEAHGDLTAALSCYEKALALDSGNTGLKERIMLLKKLLE